MIVVIVSSQNPLVRTLQMERHFTSGTKAIRQVRHNVIPGAVADATACAGGDYVDDGSWCRVIRPPVRGSCCTANLVC
jgi:hypothetical protein